MENNEHLREKTRALGGRVGRWMGGRARLKIAYSIQKLHFLVSMVAFQRPKVPAEKYLFCLKLRKKQQIFRCFNIIVTSFSVVKLSHLTSKKAFFFCYGLLL